jgi:hypothetical protein
MSRTFHHGERRIRVRELRRDPPDLRRLAQALIELAQAQIEADAQRERDDAQRRVSRTRRTRTTPSDAPAKETGDAA